MQQFFPNEQSWQMRKTVERYYSLIETKRIDGADPHIWFYGWFFRPLEYHQFRSISGESISIELIKCQKNNPKMMK